MRKDTVWQNRTSGYIETTSPSGYDILINGTNKYLNFNLISGSTGYGIRDNGGTMQFKNSAGSWTDFGSGGGGGAVDSVNGQTGVVVLDTGDISDVLNSRYVTDSQLTVIGNTSGTNTGDQDLSGLIPYTGATANVDLGTFTITTPKLISTGGNLDIEALTAGANMAIAADDAIILQGNNVYVSLRSPDVNFSTDGGSTFGHFNFDGLTVDRTYTFPDNDGTIALLSDITGGGFVWTDVTGTSQSMVINNGYIANNTSLVTCTLPSTAVVGSVIRVTGIGDGGWKIEQNTSQQIIWNEGGVDGTDQTTIGTTGYLASSDKYDSVEIICLVADTTWGVLSSKGNITIN